MGAWPRNRRQLVLARIIVRYYKYQNQYSAILSRCQVDRIFRENINKCIPGFIWLE